MATLLLTVVAGGAQFDFAVPAHVPITELLPYLAEATAPPSALTRAPLTLLGLDGVALPSDRSLAACGIGDGAVVELAEQPGIGAPLPGRGQDIGAALSLRPHPGADQRPGDAHLSVALPPARQRVRLVLRELQRRSRGGYLDDPARTRLRQRLWMAWTAGGHEERLDAAVAAVRLRRCATIGVVSASAGVGTTTVAVLLAEALSRARRGRTVMVDGSPGPGSLSDVLAPGCGVAASDLLPLLEHPALTRRELRALLVPVPGGPGELIEDRPRHRLREPPQEPRAAEGAALPRDCDATGSLALLPVLPERLPARAPALAPAEDPHPATGTGSGHGSGLEGGAGAGAALAPRGWARLLHGPAQHATTVLLDCGSGLEEPAAQAAIGVADQLVLVLAPDVGLPGERAVAALLRHGREVVAVIVGSPPGLGAAQVAARLSGVQAVVLLPGEPDRDPGAMPRREGAAALHWNWAGAPPSWRRQVRELAWLLVSDWPRLGIGDGSTGDTAGVGHGRRPP